MINILKRRIKIIMAILVIAICVIILSKNKQSSNKIVSIKEKTYNSSLVEIKNGSKIFENTDNLPNKIDIKKENNSNEVELNTKDTIAPNNIEKVNTKILENNAIINFEQPKDNGNNYEYIIENNEEEEKINFYSESGIYGYSYKINNNMEDTADKKVNKLDNSPFIIQDIDWNKDYYLHVRTVDNNGNFSENKTCKIDLPSNGINIEYVDINTGITLASPEKILGMINDNYDAKNMMKEVSEYTFIKTDGILEGKLKKEKENIKYMYAKNAVLNIKYIDKITGKEILEQKEIKGYEGENVKIDEINLKGYICENNVKSFKLNSGENNISLIYDKVGELIISYINEENNEKICEDEIVKLVYGNSYETKAKDFENYEFVKNTENKNGVIDSDKIYIDYYYKPKFSVEIKYVDIDTDKIIYKEKLTTQKGKKLKFKLKEIEGYSLIKDSNNDEESIIDEIIKSLGNDLENSYDPLEKVKKDNIKSEYEIVMDCNDSDYIIYYKKM